MEASRRSKRGHVEQATPHLTFYAHANNKLTSIESYFICVDVYRLAHGGDSSPSLPFCSHVRGSCPSSTYPLFLSGGPPPRPPASSTTTFPWPPHPMHVQTMHYNYREVSHCVQMWD